MVDMTENQMRADAFNLTDEQIAQAWDDCPQTCWRDTSNSSKVVLQHFARNIAALVAEQQPATVLPEVTDDDSLASRMRPATLADVLPDFPDLGEGAWEEGSPDQYGAPYVSYRGWGQNAALSWRFVPADPDADVKKALTEAMDPSPRGLAEADPDAILKALRERGYVVSKIKENEE